MAPGVLPTVHRPTKARTSYLAPLSGRGSLSKGLSSGFFAGDAAPPPQGKFLEKGKGRAQGARSGREGAGRGRSTQEGLGEWGETVTTPQMFRNNGTGSEPWESATSSWTPQSADEPQEAEAEFSWLSRMIRQQTGPIRRGLVETWVQPGRASGCRTTPVRSLLNSTSRNRP